jgi:hypothetical protein
MEINSAYFDQFYNKETGKEYYALCRKDAEKYAKNHKINDSIKEVMKWYKNSRYYIQMWAVCVMGCIAVKDKEIFKFLKDVVSLNPAWQVQECLAVAFDNSCYAKSKTVV